MGTGSLTYPPLGRGSGQLQIKFSEKLEQDLMSWVGEHVEVLGEGIEALCPFPRALPHALLPPGCSELYTLLQ